MRRIVILCGLSAVFSFPGWAGTHFSYPLAVFSHDHHPSPPLDAYAGGDLGIVVPSYARSYLYTAYRWMDGVPMEDQEQNQLVSYWNVKLGIEKEPSGLSGQLWFDVRNSLGFPVNPDHAFEGSTQTFEARDYIQYIACNGHGFQLAGERLRAHIDRFGAGSREVREWAQAQDMVFSGCDGFGNVPGPAPSNVHPDIQRDREYQIAAAHFVVGRFEEAERRFRQIGADPTWPGGLWAPYMAGRSLLWQARTEQDDALYRQKLRRAQVQLETVLRDDRLQPTHGAARYLLIRILMLTDHEAAARLLGLRLMSPLRANSRNQDLGQYFQLLDNVLEPGWGDPPLPSMDEVGERDGLTDWLVTFQGQRADAGEHAFARWRQTRSTAWLVAALEKAEATDPITPELLEAAK